MAEASGDPGDAERDPSADGDRRCQVCDVPLSSYNPGPNCWSHTICQPWRGPTAPPKY